MAVLRESTPAPSDGSWRSGRCKARTTHVEHASKGLRIQPVGQNDVMAIGTSILLIAVGAILRFAIQDSIEGVDLSVVGLILMIVGAIGLAIGIWMTTRYTGRSAPVARDDRYVRDDRY